MYDSSCFETEVYREKYEQRLDADRVLTRKFKIGKEILKTSLYGRAEGSKESWLISPV